MSLRILILTLAAVVALPACSFDQILGKGESTPAAAAPSTAPGAKADAGSAATRGRAAGAATEAMGAEVVAKSGQYLLCRLTDEYKGRITHYYSCNVGRCYGEQKPATDIKAAKSKAGCLNTCRSLERQQKPGSPKAYCAS